MVRVKSLLAFVLCAAMLFGMLPTGIVHAAEPGSGKFVYNDFEAGLGADYSAPTPTGNGNHTAYVVSAEGGAGWSVADGALHLEITGGQWLRTWNSVTGLEAYKYMVVRIKGGYDWEVLTGNSIAFKFGSGGAQSQVLYMTAEQLTQEYSDVAIEIPENFFNTNAGDYIYGLWIGTERGAKFTVDIDEIYFSNTLPGEEPEQPVDPPAPEKAYYSDFSNDFTGGPVASGYGDNTVSYVAHDGLTYSVADGVLHLELTNGNYLRLNNTMPDIDSYKYMIVRMKGTYDWSELSGNTLKFWFGSFGTPGDPLYVPAEQYTPEYSDVVITIPEGYFDKIGADYRTNLFISTERGAKFMVDIDEIYFSNTLPGEEPEEPVDPPAPEKAYYSDFTNDFTGGPVASGYGDNTVSYVAHDGLTYSVADGVLHLELTNANYLRLNNTMPDIDSYKYMIVRMKGTYDWPELSGNTLKFWFGSFGTPGDPLYVPAEQYTPEYSDVVITIPEGYFDKIGADYRTNLFITTERGAKFTVDIDEIYFSNTLPTVEPGITEIEVPIQESNVKLLGRTGGFDDGGRLLLEWSNAGFSFNFTGSSFELTAAGTNGESRMQPYLAYSVDGGAFTSVKVPSSADSVIRVDDLAEGSHSVTVLRINEPMSNPIYVASLKIGSASGTPQVEAPDAAADTKILFIGDSLTTAYGNLGSGRHNYTTDDQDGTQGYAWLTARHFGADAQYIAREGRGLVSNNYEGYPDYIGDILGVGSFALGTPYDLSSWTPDIVVVNVGSNDEQGKPSKTTQEQMTQAAKAFLERLRGLYPNARIIWAYDVLAQADGGAVRKGIRAAIGELGDENVEFCSLTTVAGQGTYGHPNVDEHKRLAEDLIYFIEHPGTGDTPDPDPNEGVYSEFNTPLIEGTPVDNGAGGTVTLFAIDGGTQSVQDGALHLDLSGEDKYIRFTGSLPLTDGITSTYKYMTIRIKGGATDAEGTAVTGDMLKVIFGNWGNEGNALMLKGEQLKTDEYTDVVFELTDQNFANIDPNYVTGLILRNVGEISTSVQIDRIFFTKGEAQEPETPDDPVDPPVEPPVQEQPIYSEFTTPLIKGTPVDNGAGGTITLFEMENASQSVSGGNLNLKLGDAGYIRFTGSLPITDGTNAKYKYIVLRLKGSGTRTDGSAVTGPLVKVIMCSWGNEANPVVISGSQINASGFTTVALELSDKNFAATNADYVTGLILRNAGNYNTTLQIDRIYFTNTKPSETTPDTPPVDPPVEPPVPEEPVYAEFTTPLIKGTPVDNGAGGTITLFEMENASQSVSGGNLNLKLGDAGYIRFTGSLPITDGTNAKYKYIVLRIKGSGTRTDGSAVTGPLVKVIMCSWGNEANPVVISGSQINASGFTTVALELSDKNFAATNADYVTGLILRNAGNYNTELQIDRIYFTNTKPADAATGDCSGDHGGTPTTGKELFCDFNRDLVEGKAVDNGAGGSITLFNQEGATHSVSDGALHVSYTAEGGYIRFNSSLNLATGENKSRYKYMVIRMKGSATKADGSPVTGPVLKAVMGSWGNEAKPLLVDASQLTEGYSLIVLELSDQNFANTHADYKGGLILQSAGNYRMEIAVDEIYFTNVKPAGALEPNPGGEAPNDPVEPPDDSTQPTEEPPASSPVPTQKDEPVKEPTPRNYTALYVLLGILGAALVGFGIAVVIILVKRRKAQ